MNDDRDTRGQELSTGDGNARPGQVDGQHLGGVPNDGTGTEAGGFDGGSGALWPGSAGGAFGSGAAGDGSRIVAGDTDGNGGPVAGETRPRGNAMAEPQRGRRRGKHRPNMSWWVELPILLVFALVLALLIKSFVVQAFYIPSSSMENTLEIGDKVLVNKLVYDFRSIHRGDIVVFNGDGSWDPVPARPAPLINRLWDSISGLFGTAPGVHDYIKRVIGVPGDHVACCNRQGKVTVNGIPLNEKSYLYPGDSPSEQRFNITVPPGRLWVMGDHRSVSWDSRGHMPDPGNGTIPENHVVGRAFVIVAPISRWRILPIPATFQQPQRTASAAAAPSLKALRLPGASLLGLLALPGAPAAAGIAAALPLTLWQRRIRGRLRGRRRRPHTGGSRDGPDDDSGDGPGSTGRRLG
jgi:signal peptidase I